MSGQNTQPSKSQFASVFGFLMTAIGYAVGLGAIWRFPYMIGNNGGGAFLLLMIIMSAVIAIPLAMCEMTMGRTSAVTPIVAMRNFCGIKSSFWTIIGWLGALASTLLMSYYVMITGNVAHYFILTLKGAFAGKTAADMSVIYNNIVSCTPMILAYNVALLCSVAFIIARGVSGGLEKFSKIALPTLFVCMVICAVHSLKLPAAGQAVKWFLTPDFSKITPPLLLDCLSQTIFLAGIGFASLFCFGSYLPKSVDLPKSALIIVESNVVIALLAGFIIFPAVFSFGLSPSSGSSLVFQTMPMLFANMSGGMFFGPLFFLCLFIAAFSTCLGLTEGVTACISDYLNMSRKTVAWAVCGTITLLSLLPTLCYTPVLGNVRLFGKDLFTLLDFLASYVLILVGGFLIVLFCIFKWGYDEFMKNVNEGARLFTIKKWMHPLFSVVCPLIIAVVFIIGVKAMFF